MVTGEKRTCPKKIWFGGSGHYGRIMDKLWMKRSKNVWKQISDLKVIGTKLLVTKDQVQKKYGLAVAGITDELWTNVMDTRTDNCFLASKNSRKFY